MHREIDSVKVKFKEMQEKKLLMSKKATNLKAMLEIFSRPQRKEVQER